MTQGADVDALQRERIVMLKPGKGSKTTREPKAPLKREIRAMERKLRS